MISLPKVIQYRGKSDLSVMQTEEPFVRYSDYLTSSSFIIGCHISLVPGKFIKFERYYIAPSFLFLF